jgi:site-specific DNA-methyltransferase (adenine-specific)
MGAIIWQKKTTTNTTGGASIMGSYPYPRNGIISIDYEFILLFKKLGKPVKLNKQDKLDSKLTKEEWKEYFSGHWKFGGVRQDKHVAMFPEELPKRLIKMFTFVGETIVDPFLGSGTTTLAAKNLNRNSIGFEINKDFKPLIEKKLDISQRNIFKTNVEFITKDNENYNFRSEIAKLPYIFKDPHQFDKKIDPRKLQYGSKINNKSSRKYKYFRVKQILSPALIKLNNDLVIRLIGIKERKEKYNQAIEFLKLKTKNQQVYIKFDDEKYDEDKNLLCYLYLKNRTFINSHLLKKGLAKLDTSMNYRYKTKFINLYGNDDE